MTQSIDMLFGKPKNFDPPVVFGSPPNKVVESNDTKQVEQVAEREKPKFFIGSEFQNGMKIMGRRTREQAQLDKIPISNGEEKVTEVLKKFK